jgi:hypothetical protein
MKSPTLFFSLLAHLTVFAVFSTDAHASLFQAPEAAPGWREAAVAFLQGTSQIWAGLAAVEEEKTDSARIQISAGESSLRNAAASYNRLLTELEFVHFQAA